MKERFLGVDEAAAYTGMKPRFIRRLIEERRIRYYKVGKFVRFSEADLDAFMRAEVVEPFPRRIS